MRYAKTQNAYLVLQGKPNKAKLLEKRKKKKKMHASRQCNMTNATHTIMQLNRLSY